MRRRTFTVAILALGAALTLTAPEAPLAYWPERDKAVLDTIDRWQDLKLGLLMHWGPYSQWGVVESWSICSEDEEWCQRSLPDYVEYKRRYENLKRTFNPVRFDPGLWAAAARDAGMRYVVFTTKHHDGFAMFDTRQSDYRVTDAGCAFGSNPRANIANEIFDAFRREGFMIGAYFSKPDWHNEDYWWPNFATPDRNVNYEIARYPERWQRFVEFTHRQIMELMTGYGRIDILWLDGGWVRIKTEEEIRSTLLSARYATRPQSQDIRMDDLVRKARAQQPGLIVVDRAVPGPYENYLTPEAVVPEAYLPYPWETCMPMGERWSYAFGETYKSAGELIRMLVDVVAKGGNLLLNIAPSPDGTWDEEAYRRLAEIGGWMKVNGDAIYQTRPLPPYRAGALAYTQKRDGTAYALYRGEGEAAERPAEMRLCIVPAPGARVSMLGSNRRLRWRRQGAEAVVEIPPSLRERPPCEHAWALRISEVAR